MGADAGRGRHLEHVRLVDRQGQPGILELLGVELGQQVDLVLGRAEDEDAGADLHHGDGRGAAQCLAVDHPEGAPVRVRKRRPATRAVTRRSPTTIASEAISRSVSSIMLRRRWSR